MRNEVLKDLRETVRVMRQHGSAPIVDVPASYAQYVFDELAALGVEIEAPSIGNDMNIDFREIGRVTLRVH